MATVRIDFSDVSDASKRAQEASDRMLEYASHMEQRVGNRLGSLTCGPTSLTSAAQALAQEKARSLRDKAADFSSLHRKLDKLYTAAENADARVESDMRSRNETSSQNLGALEKVTAWIHMAYSTVVGNSEFGKALNQFGKGVRGLATDALQKARDFFVYGKGRYILQDIGQIVGVAFAIKGLVKSIGVFMAVAAIPGVNVIAGVVVLAAVVATAITAVTAFTTLKEQHEALKHHDDDPGYARYHGKATSLEDYAKRNVYDEGAQEFAHRVDVAGHVTGFVRDIGSAFLPSTVSGGVVRLPEGDTAADRRSWMRGNLKENLLDKFGERVPNEGVSEEALKGMGEGEYLKSTHLKFSLGKTLGFKTWKKDAEGVKDGFWNAAGVAKNSSSVVKDAQTFFDQQRRDWKLNAKDWKGVLKKVPVVKDFVDVGDDAIDYFSGALGTAS